MPKKTTPEHKSLACFSHVSSLYLMMTVCVCFLPAQITGMFLTCVQPISDADCVCMLVFSQQAPFREEITVQLSSTAEEVVLVEDGDTTGGENVIVTSGHLKPQLEHQSSNADSDYDNANPAADSGSSTR